MCGCEHHWDRNAPCTCTCPDHTLTDAERAMFERIEDTGDTQGLTWRVQELLAARLATVEAEKEALRASKSALVEKVKRLAMHAYVTRAEAAEAALAGLVAAVSELADEWDVRAKALGECTGPNCAGCQLGAAASRLRGRITADHAAALRAHEALAWDDAVTEGFDGGWLHDVARDDLLARNPYRAEQAHP